MNNKAFTLSELLIAIVVIGVILLATLPGIVDNMNSKNRVAALQRAYLLTSNAVKIMMNDEHASSIEKTYLYKSGSASVEDTAGEFIYRFFKLAQDCGTTMTPCFAQSYRTLDNSKNISFSNYDDMYCVLFASRASMCLIPPHDAESGIVIVDVNGAVKPNIAGRDLFTFYIYSDGYVGDKDNDAAMCDNNEQGLGCFTKLVKSNWVMNY